MGREYSTTSQTPSRSTPAIGQFHKSEPQSSRKIPEFINSIRLVNRTKPEASYWLRAYPLFLREQGARLAARPVSEFNPSSPEVMRLPERNST